MNRQFTLKGNLCLTSAVISMLALLLACPAWATYKGQNGRIAFTANTT